MLRHIRKKEKVFNFLTCCNCYCKFLVGMLPNLLQRHLYSQSAEMKVFVGQVYISLSREYSYMWEILPPCQSLPPKPALFPRSSVCAPEVLPQLCQTIPYKVVLQST